MNDVTRTPRSFVFASVSLAACAVMLVVSNVDAGMVVARQLAVLIIAALVSENFALSLPAFNVSLAFPLIVAGFVLVGPGGGAIVASVCFTNYHEIRAHRSPLPMMYNFGQLVIAASVGGYIYESTGGTVLWDGSAFSPLLVEQLPKSAASVVAAALVAFSLNVVLTAYAVSALRSCSAIDAAKSMSSYLMTQLALALVGLLMAQVLAIASAALPLFLFPLVLARQVFQRYEEMRGAYLDTVRSLIGALEAKDPYTRGHSERVAEYARRIGEHAGLDASSLDRLQTSALLHDIGKLALSADLLTKPSSLSDEEFEAMRKHPSLGASMVKRIPPLSQLACNVGMHHERLDGRGYPSGLTAEQIPTLARILAVADAYDAMTTKRAYRDAMPRESAFAELVAQSGRQFDSSVVANLLACERDGDHVEQNEVSLGDRVAGAEGAC